MKRGRGVKDEEGFFLRLDYCRREVGQDICHLRVTTGNSISLAEFLFLSEFCSKNQVRSNSKFMVFS